MKKKLVSLVVCIAFLAVLAVPIALSPVASAAKPPVLVPGDNWVYAVNYNPWFPPPIPPWPPIVPQNHLMAVKVVPPADAYNYKLYADYINLPVQLPPGDAVRNTWVPPAPPPIVPPPPPFVPGWNPVTVQDADAYVNKKNMLYTKWDARIMAFGFPGPWVPDFATVKYTYTSALPKWPPALGSTWSFTKNISDAAGFVNYTVNRQALVVGIENHPVGPIGMTFSTLHIVEWDPALAGAITYEHWFSQDVGADVETIDYETYQGTETRQLWTTNYGPMVTSITPNVLGNGKGNVQAIGVSIAGSNFMPGSKTKVMLLQSGAPKPKKKAAKNVVVNNPNSITCDLKLDSALPGDWDVVVTSPNKRTGRLLRGLKVNPHPVITSMTPSSASNTGSVAVTIAGSDFATSPDATVKLTKKGLTDITDPAPIVSSGSISCNFNLTGAAVGTWVCVVRNPDGGIGTFKFKVTL